MEEPKSNQPMVVSDGHVDVDYAPARNVMISITHQRVTLRRTPAWALSTAGELTEPRELPAGVVRCWPVTGREMSEGAAAMLPIVQPGDKITRFITQLWFKKPT